jgi:inner membrane protein
MEPVTHFLTGACIGRAGLNRKTAYATLAAVLAAEAADIDILWAFAGPVEELKHHRGITHTLIGAPLVAGVVVGVIWLVHLWVQKRRSRKLAALSGAIHPGASNSDASVPDGVRGLPPFPQESAERLGHGAFSANTARGSLQPVSWAWVYASALISALSHLLLDWTNNYGLRPFFPFNPHWYAGSFVFIVEPVLLALLLPAMIVPGLLGLVAGEIGVRQKAFRGRGWAIFALSGMVLVWGWRWAEHAQAQALVENTQIASAPVKRVALEPYPVNPFRWHAILETEDFYQTAEIDNRNDSIDSDPNADVLFKPPSTAATEAAKRTLLGQVYLDWGTWAVVHDVGQKPVAGMDPPQLPSDRAANWTTVEFTDLRFGYSYLGAGRATGRSPLGGWVYIVDGRDDAGEAMGGREQR